MIALAFAAGSLALADPSVDAAVLGSLGSADAPVAAGLGLGASLPLPGPLRLGLRAEGGAVLAEAPTPRLALRPELRLLASPPLAPAQLAAILGAGVVVEGGAAPELALGAGFDLPGRDARVPRVEARYLLAPTARSQALQLSLGVGWRRARAPALLPVAEVPPQPATEPAAPQTDFVWVPHPVRQCVASSRVHGADEPAALDPSALPAGLDLEGLLRPTQGSLVVAARPGDRVRVGGVELPSRADGSVVSNVAAGPLDIEILGAGRRRVVQSAVAAGYALWVRGDSDDAPHRVRFPAGSAVLDAEERARLREIVAAAGGWSFELQGSFSAEGALEANRRLAEQRADAVARALLDAGLDAERLKRVPAPLTPDERLSLVDQRATVLRPVRPPAATP